MWAGEEILHQLCDHCMAKTPLLGTYTDGCRFLAYGGGSDLPGAKMNRIQPTSAWPFHFLANPTVTSTSRSYSIPPQAGAEKQCRYRTSRTRDGHPCASCHWSVFMAVYLHIHIDSIGEHFDGLSAPKTSADDICKRELGLCTESRKEWSFQARPCYGKCLGCRTGISSLIPPWRHSVPAVIFRDRDRPIPRTSPAVPGI